jgi:ribonuclease-3
MRILKADQKEKGQRHFCCPIAEDSRQGQSEPVNWLVMGSMENAETADNLTTLETLLRVTFRNRAILQRAITHHSYCPDDAVHGSYDTLEFLGDAIISAHVVEHIYRAFPDASEGQMTALKSEVVSRRVLAQIGQNLGLFPFILVDIANLRTFNERSRDSLCADVLEAIVGAIHIDQGPEAARSFVEWAILPVIGEIDQQTETNPKGRLQKLLLQRSGILPHYRVLEQSGRQNDRVFEVGVFAQDILLGIGKASSIKEAGRLAAREALQQLQKKEAY